MQNPIALTISMPNYNHSSYLSRRIPSLLAAMPSNSELVIVDDGSMDGSGEIIQKFAEQDQRIVFIRKKKNEGVIRALQDILSVARGEFVSFQSADDFILPDFFTELLSFAEKNPGYAIYTSHFGYCNDTIPEDLAEIKFNPLLPHPENSYFFKPDEIVEVFFKSEFWVPGHASIIQREKILKAGGFKSILKQHADWFLIHSVALMGGVAYLPKTLSAWRLAQDSFTSQELKNEKDLKEVHMNFLRTLSTKGMEDLRDLFRRSSVMRGVIRRRRNYLCFCPIYWDFLLWYVGNSLYRKFQRIFKLKLDLKKYEKSQND